MKSSPIELKKRGYADDEDLKEFQNSSKSSDSSKSNDSRTQELLALLIDKQPHKRTIATKLLIEYPQPKIAQYLCEALQKEKKSYTKIALTETLASFEEISLPYLIPLLGKIGTNQYKNIPEKTFIKKNYPLPRDIIARTIIRIGEKSLPHLEKIAMNGERIQILEAIDAIGFISFYSQNTRSLPILWKVLENFPKDDLMLWKVIRAFESFPNERVISFLNKILEQNVLPGIRIEARRSLTQINNFSLCRFVWLLVLFNLFCLFYVLICFLFFFCFPHSLYNIIFPFFVLIEKF